MSMTPGSRKGVSSEMNVTPLIDVLLVLLIIFMVLLPHHYVGEAADIPLPASDTPRPPYDPVVIQVLDAGPDHRPMLKINEEQVSWDSLEGRLQEIFRIRMAKVAFLKGDPEVDFEQIADVLDISHRAGVQRIGLMDEKSKR